MSQSKDRINKEIYHYVHSNFISEELLNYVQENSKIHSIMYRGFPAFKKNFVVGKIYGHFGELTSWTTTYEGGLGYAFNHFPYEPFLEEYANEKGLYIKNESTFEIIEKEIIPVLLLWEKGLGVHIPEYGENEIISSLKNFKIENVEEKIDFYNKEENPYLLVKIMPVIENKQ